MKIKAINVEIQLSRGKPLFYSINPGTVGSDKFALLAGIAQGQIESDRIRTRWERVNAKISRRNAKN